VGEKEDEITEEDRSWAGRKIVNKKGGREQERK
jgi:hypothetical protein